jgi:carbon storage regulator
VLVLTRKIGERIVVPQLDLSVAIVSVQGNRVRLGISAPDEVAVYREELWSGSKRRAETRSQKSTFSNR